MGRHRWRREEQWVKIIPDLNRCDKNVCFVRSDSSKHQGNLRTVCEAHMAFGQSKGTPLNTKRGFCHREKRHLVAFVFKGDKGDKWLLAGQRGRHIDRSSKIEVKRIIYSWQSNAVQSWADPLLCKGRGNPWQEPPSRMNIAFRQRHCPADQKPGKNTRDSTSLIHHMYLWARQSDGAFELFLLVDVIKEK